jgi:hypothetical protein
MSSRPELKVSSPHLYCVVLITLQVEDEQSFIRFFRALPVKDDETVRIFNRGDYYTAHGDDANFIARAVS